jgi:hypothetical protein
MEGTIDEVKIKKEDAKFQELVTFFKSLRISTIDSKDYTKKFIELGYDDVQSIIEDMHTTTLESIHMKQGIIFIKIKKL